MCVNYFNYGYFNITGKMKMDCPKQLSGDMRHLTECYGMHEDPSHWGMAVNIVKAHLVFAEIQKMHSKKT